jgi:hypothetical protein
MTFHFNILFCYNFYFSVSGNLHFYIIYIRHQLTKCKLFSYKRFPIMQLKSVHKDKGKKGGSRIYTVSITAGEGKGKR